MKRACVVVLFLAVTLAAAVSLRAEGASKYKPCSLFTTAEVEAVLGGKVTGTRERDIPITQGPSKGETISECTWIVGVKGSVMLIVSPRPRTPEQRAEGDAKSKQALDVLRRQGWTITETKIRGSGCMRAVPPASNTASAAFALCGVESKGLALSVTVSSPTVTVQQAKTLLDKAVARLP